MVIGIKPSLDPNNPFSQFYPVNVTIKAQASNGLALNAYSAYDYRQAKQLGIDAMIIGYVFMAFAILFCYGDWKELGL